MPTLTHGFYLINYNWSVRKTAFGFGLFCRNSEDTVATGGEVEVVESIANDNKRIFSRLNKKSVFPLRTQKA